MKRVNGYRQVEKGCGDPRRERIFVRWIAVGMLSTVLILGLTGCGDQDSDTTGQASPTGAASTETVDRSLLSTNGRVDITKSRIVFRNGERETIREADYDGEGILTTVDGLFAGTETVADEARAISLFDEDGDARVLHVVDYPETLISSDGQTIVKLGDENRHSLPSTHNLVFYDRSGKVKREIREKHLGSTFAMSGDGFVVVGGRIVGDEEQRSSTIVLYSPDGEEVWETRLEPYDWAQMVQVSDEGARVAISILHQEGDEEVGANSLLILGEDGSLVTRHDEIEGLQRIVFVDSYLAVQSHDRFLFLDAGSGELLWQKPSFTLVGDNAVTIMDGELILVTLEVTNRSPLEFHWIAKVLDVTSGGRISEAKVPASRPETNDRLFVRTGNDLLVFNGSDLFPLN